MLEGVEPLYNRLLLAAAKKWIYRPARLDGAPVKYRKRIQITLTAYRSSSARALLSSSPKVDA